ncbi:centrosomal protein of 19 kDa [Corythoichthys intestinalis]|uniref:centrosomal protein of 19 kDa n=1 Tax=Corythoichthys intestinalis TaxID=161448 RepID=UPI0025A62283|nr:centrosomal protein of 19 kDa [Corythoichthys intestinalis]XP_061790194.1 centrosomal protein of 19 kDa-like [Nerophis lumbriciformis]
MPFEAKRCGVCFSPPSIVLIYEVTETNKLRKRVIPVQNFSARTSDYKLAAERLKNHPRHKDYLQGVSQSQLERLHVILRDYLQGFTLQHSLASLEFDPNEDLNKLDDDNLARKKSHMDKLFEKNQTRREDPGFVYDLEVDFDKIADEKCSWDEDSDDGF